ncbi:MAG: hypothetical protein EOL88_11090 [Bacteroidia bacterium]|nr:hypothetical protein [Bacteroidia bacterium]
MLLNIEKAYPELVRTLDVIRFRQDGFTYEFVAKVELIDRSILHIRDYLFFDGSHKYAYQWQYAEGKLIARWDNARHWPNVSSYPHHVHTKDGDVLCSNVRSLEDVLAEIQRRIRD